MGERTALLAEADGHLSVHCGEAGDDGCRAGSVRGALGRSIRIAARRDGRCSVRAIVTGHLARIHDTAQLARRTGSADAVVDHVRSELTDLPALDGCRFEYGSLLRHPPQLLQDGEVTTAHGRWSVERRGWPPTETELRVFGNGHYFGRYMLRPGRADVVPLQTRLVAVPLADQVGAAPADAGAGPALEG